MPSAKRVAILDVDHGGHAEGEPARPKKGRKRLMVSIGLLFITILLLVVTQPFMTHPRAELSAVLPGMTLEDVAKPGSVVVTSIQGSSLQGTSNANAAGIRVGDRIVAIDTRPIASRADLRHYLDARHPRAVDLQLARGGRPVEVIYAFPESNRS